MKNKNSKFTIILFMTAALLLASFSCYAKEKEPEPEEVDYISIAARLLNDGYYARVVAVLDNVDLEDEKVDLITYYTLRGMAFTRLGKLEEAVDSFKLSIESGQQDKNVYIYLSHLYFKLKKYREVIDSLDKAGQLALDDPKFFLLRAECYWRLKSYDKAFVALNSGIKHFPDQPIFDRQRFYYFLQLKLYQSAIDAANIYLTKGLPKVDDYIAVGTALLGAGHIDEAVIFLQKARLYYPNNDKVLVTLANAYVKKGYYGSGARIFEKLSIFSPEYAKDAAELYRRNGQYFHALYLNSKVADQPAKIKQKLAILLDMKAFELISNMEYAISRTALFSDDSIRYAFSYALIFTGKLDAAERYLKGIQDAGYFQKATKLLEMIERCRNNPQQCLSL